MRSVLLAGLFISASALAQGSGAHLEPDDSVFDKGWRLDYYSNVARVLGDVVPEQAPKVYVLPSNMPEYVVGIDDRESSCSIVVGRVEHTLWAYESRKDAPDLELPADWPKDPLDVEVEVDAQPAPRHFCDRIQAVWIATLLETRYPDSGQVQIGLDGVSFHFSVWLRGMGMLHGKIWSPEPMTTPGKLVALAHAMRNFARTGSQDTLARVQTALAELERASAVVSLE